VRASGPDIALRHVAGPRQFERTVLMIDTSGGDSYLLDIFRVVGGKDHAKFQHSHFATLETRGLSLTPDEDFAPDTQMRNFHTDRAARQGWSAEFRIEDRYGYLPPGRKVRLAYTDLTNQAEASTCEGWVVAGGYDARIDSEVWIPRLMIRRRGETEPLASAFVAVIEPHEGKPTSAAARRLPLVSDAEVAVEVNLTDGRRDVIIARDMEDPLQRRAAGPIEVAELGVVFDGDLCVIRYEGERPRLLAAWKPRFLRIGGRDISLPPEGDFVEESL
jgi:hypothetical protein